MDSAGAVLCLSVFWLTWSRLDGRIYYKTIPVHQKGHLTSLTLLMDRGFGFLAEGEVHFSMSCGSKDMTDYSNFWLLFCSPADAREFTRLPYTQLDFECQRLKLLSGSRLSPSTSSGSAGRSGLYCKSEAVTESNASTGETFGFSETVRRAAFYSVMLLQCGDPPGVVDGGDGGGQAVYRNVSEGEGEEEEGFVVTKCQSSLRAMNPGDVHLSSDEIPLPVIYTIINLFWATLVGAWFFNWVIYFKFSNRLHQLISCAPIFKVIQVVLILLWWQEIAHTGVEPSDISSIRVLVSSIEDSLLFITMMVISEGWGVVRSQIKYYRWTSLILLFLLFATSLMCVHWVHRYFLAFSICCVVFIMYKTLKWTSHNIDLLRRRRRKIRRFVSRHNLRYKGLTTLDMQLMAKLHIYQKFRVVCATFSMIYAIAITLGTFLSEYTDIKALTFEIPKLLVYTAIGVIFRLRNFEPYENIELVPPKENVVVIELPDVCFGYVDPHVTLGIPLHFKVEKETQTPRRRWRAPII